VSLDGVEEFDPEPSSFRPIDVYLVLPLFFSLSLPLPFPSNYRFFENSCPHPPLLCRFPLPFLQFKFSPDDQASSPLPTQRLRCHPFLLPFFFFFFKSRQCYATFSLPFDRRPQKFANAAPPVFRLLYPLA